MRSRSILIGLILPWSGFALSAQTNVSTVPSREAVVEAAAKLGKAVDVVGAPHTVAVDPFNPPAANLRWDTSPESGGKVSTVPDDQLAKLLIDLVKPTGSIQLGGEPYLLFTERRQKIGDKLVVTLDKVEYVIEIVSIANNRFRIRYNGQEAERPIK
ncbi:MAG: hypothetical protein QM691_10260 [Opitutaceae bacterium]